MSPSILTPGVNASRDGRRVYRLEGLPDFNALDTRFTIQALTGLRGSAGPDAQLVANGGGPGALAVGGWVAKERYHELSGTIVCDDRPMMEAMDRALLQSLPAHREASIKILDPVGGIDKQVFVRRYDEPEVTFTGNVIRFKVPLVAPDPFKYALEPLGDDGGAFGVFMGSQWWREYESGERVYVATERAYVREWDAAGLPSSARLVSTGDAASQRVRVSLQGPLARGAWRLAETVSGREMWADLALTASQALAFDSYSKTVRLDGADVTHLMYGDWLELSPGVNDFRIVAASPGASATIEAWEAFQ